MNLNNGRFFFCKLFLRVPISIVLSQEKKSSLLASLLSTFPISSSCRESKLRSCGTCLGIFITAFFYQHFHREVRFRLLWLTHHTSCVQSMRKTVLKALFEKYENTWVQREDGPLRSKFLACVIIRQILTDDDISEKLGVTDHLIFPLYTCAVMN